MLRDVSLGLKCHDVLCLLGPNGTGKTTLLRCLLGLLKPSGGRIILDGQDMTAMSLRARARYLGYVPQASSMAFPYESEEIVFMGRIAHQKGRRESGQGGPARVRGGDGIPGQYLICGEKLFNRLSGGERQMVLVARPWPSRLRSLPWMSPPPTWTTGTR